MVRELIGGKVRTEASFSKGTTSYCMLTEKVITFYCIKVEYVWQKSQGVILDRTCNLSL